MRFTITNLKSTKLVEVKMIVVDHRDRPFIRSASGDPCLWMVVNREVGASSLSVWTACHEVGDTAPVHSHEVEEVLTLISGEATVTVGDDTIEAREGMSIIVPAGTPHGYRNSGKSPLRIIVALAGADVMPYIG
jgi:mannose-6-phosphate isomerase-like protein (cupin superfamily)